MAWGCNWMGFKIHSNSSHSVIKDAPLLHEHAGQKSHWDNSNLHMETCRICKYLCETEERELHILMSYSIRSLTHAHRKVHAGLAIIFFLYCLGLVLGPDTVTDRSGPRHTQPTLLPFTDHPSFLHRVDLAAPSLPRHGLWTVPQRKRSPPKPLQQPWAHSDFLTCLRGKEEGKKEKKKSQQKNPNSCEFIDSPLRISGAVNSTFMVLAN